MTSTPHASRLASRAVFVTGTDTGVGKTVVTVALIEALKRQGLRVAGMKPVAAGLDENGVNEDVARIMASTNVAAALDDVCPYRFAPAIAPHVAARRAGVRIGLDRIRHAYQRLAARADWVVVEGSGGFLVPLDDMLGMEAIPLELHLPVVLVVGMRLGCLNHARLTAEAIRARGLPLAGWVANQIDPAMPAQEENLASLMRLVPAPCLGVVPWLAEPMQRAGACLEVAGLVIKNTQT